MPMMKVEFLIGATCKKKKGGECRKWKAKSWTAAEWATAERPEIPFYDGCMCRLEVTGNCCICTRPAQHNMFFANIDAKSKTSSDPHDTIQQSVCEKCILIVHGLLKNLAEQGVLQNLMQKHTSKILLADGKPANKIIKPN